MGMKAAAFGIQIEPQFGFTFDLVRDIAASAEDLGFESLWVSDHFFMTREAVDVPALECWTLISALATCTEKLVLGPMVAAQSFRNPALAANIASSLDHITGGRICFGIGAGWKREEYKAYGYPFPPFATRMQELDETIEIVKRMWTQARPSFEGEHYRIDRAVCYPHPVRSGGIPIWVGGASESSLRLATRHGDALNFAWSDPIDHYREKYARLEQLCEEAGRDHREIRRSAGLMITMAETEPALKARLEAQQRRDDPYMRYVKGQLTNIIGTPEQVADRVREYQALGVDHFILRFHFEEEVEMMDLFMREVATRL